MIAFRHILHRERYPQGGHRPPSLMRQLLALTAILALSLLPASARAAEENDALASKVLTLFQDKCFKCHSPQAKKIKKFGFINDLNRLAHTQKYITPGHPEKSDLFRSVSENEMPPDDSGIAPCSAEQKKLLEQWILAGAPAGQTATLFATSKPSTNPSVASGADDQASPRKLGFFLRAWRFLGKFHPLAAHFPIAVLLGAVIAELICLRYPSYDLTVASRFCTVLGAAGAIVTAALGWVAATHHSVNDMLEPHRWLGTWAAVSSIPVALICEWGSRRAAKKQIPWRGVWRILYRISLFACAAAICVAAHYGGLLAWGEGYFNF